MRLAVALPLLAALAACHGLTVQKPASPLDPPRENVAPACSQTQPYFEFQVERPARFLADSVTLAPGSLYPSKGSAGDSTVVQFVVDTVGRPVIESFKVLHARDVQTAAELRGAVERWRYTPARRGSCAVRQLVQTGVARY